ncbi:MAG: EAL domain-containing protein [Rhizobiaceae bacterium]|nr:EAL domain-containing protein [Rhizobiaceae bacterium]
MDTIISDEIGVQYAVMGHYRLHTLYRQVFASHVAGLLSPLALQAELVVSRDGVPVSERVEADRQIGLQLAIRNLAQSDGAELDLFVDLPDGQGAIDDLADELAAAELEPSRVTVFLDSAEEAVALRLRETGVNLGLAARLNDEKLADSFAACAPQTIRIDGDWLRRAAGSRELSALLRRFMETCRDARANVFANDIGEAYVLTYALELGVDFLAGEALRPAQAPGAAMDLEPLATEGLKAGADNVVPFARRQSII